MARKSSRKKSGSAGGPPSPTARMVRWLVAAAALVLVAGICLGMLHLRIRAYEVVR